MTKAHFKKDIFPHHRELTEADFAGCDEEPSFGVQEYQVKAPGYIREGKKVTLWDCTISAFNPKEAAIKAGQRLFEEGHWTSVFPASFQVTCPDGRVARILVKLDLVPHYQVQGFRWEKP